MFGLIIHSLLLISAFSLSEKPKTIEVCISEEENELFELLNEYRESKKLAPIPFSAALTKVAQAHVRDLHFNYNFSPDAKCNPHSWSKKGEWSDCCYTNDHKQAQCMWDKPKEIAGYNSAGYEIAYYQSNGAEPFVALEGWKKSKGHNPVMVNSGIWEKVTWEAMGVGIFEEYGVVWFGAKSDPSEIIICDQ